MEKVNSRLLIAVLIILATLAVTAYYYPVLPQKWPSHFDAAGNPDAWTQKGLMTFAVVGMQIAMLGIMWICYYFLEDPQRFRKSQKYSIGTKNLTPQATEQVRLTSLKLLDWIMFLSLIMSGQIQLEALLVATGRMSKLSVAIWVFLAFLFIGMFYYTGKLLRISLKKENTSEDTSIN